MWSRVGQADRGQAGALPALQTAELGHGIAGSGQAGEGEEEGEMTGKRNILTDAIAETLARKVAEGGPLVPLEIVRVAIQGVASAKPEQWAEFRDDYVLVGSAATLERQLQRQVEQPDPDPRQGWLALPEYQHVPQLIEAEAGFVDVNEATLEQYRESETKLAARIHSYDYPRRAPKSLKRDKQALAQMRKVDKRVSPLMAGNPEMKMGRAIEIYLESPSIRQRQKAGKARQGFT